MGFIQTIIDQHQKKVQERNDACNDLISRIDDACLLYTSDAADE